MCGTNPQALPPRRLSSCRERRAQGSPVRGFISTLKAPTLLAGLVLALGTEIHASTATAVGAAVPGSPRSGPRQETVVPNDNRHPAGTLDRGTLTLTLRAGRGSWQPEGPAGSGAHDRSIRGNVVTSDRAGAVDPGGGRHADRGLDPQRSRRRAARPRALRARRHGVPAAGRAASETREVASAAAAPAPITTGRTTMGAPVPFRELAGAFVVDPPGGAVEDDRVMVITEWTSLTAGTLHEVMRRRRSRRSLRQAPSLVSPSRSTDSPGPPPSG